MNTAKDTIADLVVDIRFSQRKIDAGLNVVEETRYQAKCKDDVRRVFKARHNFLTDQYGWPLCLAGENP